MTMLSERNANPHFLSLLNDPGYRQLKSFIIEKTGLAYYQDRDEFLARHLLERMTESGKTGCKPYLDLIIRSQDEYSLLVSRLTVGETYFFRYPEQYEFLRDLVIPDAIRENRKRRQLTIWSAGCSSGAEAYSTVILLKQHFAMDLSGWDIRILATDIDEEALARARSGRFSKWELRTLDREERLAHFIPKGSLWQLKPDYMENVTFQYANLLDDLKWAGRFDIVFCRNVLIYFDIQTMRQILMNLSQKMRPGGWLLVGHAEPHFDIVNFYQPVTCGKVTLYRNSVKKNNEQPAALTETPPQPLPPLEIGHRPSASDRPPSGAGQSDTGAQKPAMRHRPERQQDLAAVVVEIRGLADCGDWENALKKCDAASKEFPFLPELHCYRALILEQTGHWDAAKDALNAALYLKPDYTLALYHLGRTQIDQGMTDKGIRNLEKVLSLLSEQDDDQPVDPYEKLTVGALKNYACLHLELARSKAGEQKG